MKLPDLAPDAHEHTLRNGILIAAASAAAVLLVTKGQEITDGIGRAIEASADMDLYPHTRS